MGYEYCLEDRIQNPHLYMYTKYEGRPFLDEYFGVRADCMDRLAWAYEARYGEADLRDVDGCLDEITKEAEQRDANGPGLWFGKNVGNGPAATTEILEDALYLIWRSGGADRRNKVRAFLNTLTAKFEVFKRLFSFYDRSVRKVGDDYEDVSCYILFALCLGAWCRGEEDLKFLNTALKVNDLVCSVIDRIHACPDIMSAYASLALEREAIQGLLNRKGLS